MNPAENDPKMLPKVLTEYTFPMLLPRSLKLLAYIRLTSGKVAPISIVGISITKKDSAYLLITKFHHPVPVKPMPISYSFPYTGINSMADNAMPV